MAIRKVTRVINGESKEVLGLDDILEQVGANRGDSADFIGLAEVVGIPILLENNEQNPIVLPDSFEGKDLDLDAGEATVTPSNLNFIYTAQTKTISVEATGVYRISSSPPWVNINRTFAKDNSSFSVTALNNSSISSPSRTGSIIFTGYNNTTIATVNVSQDGNPLIATISPSSTQTLNGSAGTTTITVRLSDSLTPAAPILTNEDETEFTLSSPTESTSNSITTYTYTLTRFETSDARSITITFGYTGDGISEQFSPLTFNQQGFQPTLGVTPTELNYPAGGNTLYYDVVDADTNTNWSATISGTGYSHSTSNTSGFKTTAITGTSAGDRIYVKASSHTGAAVREGTATITTTYGSNDVSKTVDLSQAAADTWDDTDITITGFAVASNGDITVPDVTTTGDISYTIQYSTTDTFASTDLVTVTDGFDLVSTDTIRYVRVSVTVPNGYTNQNTTFRKTAEATQDGLPIFKNSQITMEATRAFAVNSTGTFTSPSVSVPSGITYTLRYTTGDNNTGTAYTLAFPKVSTAVTRYANAVVIVPEGYFNEGQTVFKTVNDIQEVFNPSLTLTSPSNGTLPEFSILGQTQSFSFESNYSWVSTIGPAGFEQSFTQTSGFTTDDLTGIGDKTIWVRALKNPGEPRDASVSVSTNFGSLDDTILVTLTQDGEPTYTISKWLSQTPKGVVSINGQTGAVSATTGTSLTAPTLNPTSFALVADNTNRTVSVTVTAPDNYNNHNSLVTGDVTVIQPAFAPSINAVQASRTFQYTGGTTYYDVETNYAWKASISGAGFSHSTSQTGTFVTTDINRTASQTRIWVKAAGHLGAEREGTATVTTRFTKNNDSDTVRLIQLEAPNFLASNIEFTRDFAVSYTGAITAPITNPAATEIIYSTTKNGTSVSSFSEVTVNTTRWCRVSVTVPAGYQNTGNTVTKDDIQAEQPFKSYINVYPEPLPFEFSNGIESNTLNVNSNTTWEVTQYPSWIEIDDTTGGGTDTTFVATSISAANPSTRKYGYISTSTTADAATHGSATDNVYIQQAPKSTWSFSNIPALPYQAWQKEILNEFSKNIPFVFDYMLTTFKQGQFAVYTTNTTNSKSGAALSSSSNKFTAGDKTFVVTRNTNLLTSDTSLGFDVGHWVSVSEIKVLGSNVVTKYMVGTVKSWNYTTKTLVVTIPANNSNFTSNKTIESDNTTTNYTSWEIYQISGTASHSVTLISRAENKTSSPITAILSVNDTDNTYENASLIKTVTQSLPPFEGWIYNPYNLSNTSQASWGEIGVGGTYTRNSVWTDSDTTPEVMSFSVRTSYAVSMTVTITANGIVLRAPGSTSTIGVSSITFTTQRFDESNVSHFELYASAPSAGGSRSCSLSFTSTTPSSSTQLDVVLNRDEAASVSTVTNTVDTSTVKIVNER